MLLKRSKFLAGALSVLLLLGGSAVFAGGAKEQAAEEEDVKADAELSWAERIEKNYSGVTLNMSMAKHPATEAIREMSKEFTAMTGIKINWETGGETGGALKNKQLIDLSMGGGTYDVLSVDTFWVDEYVEKEVIMALDPFIADPALTPDDYDYDDFNAGFRSSGSRNGNVYGLPFSGATRVVAYRKDLFEEYGKTEPENLDEMLELARFFKDEVPGVDGMTMRARQGIMFASAWLQLIYQFGGGIVDQKTLEPTIDSPESIRSLEYFIEILKTGPQGIESFGWEEGTSAFASGKVALWYDGTPIVMRFIEDPDSSEVIGKVGYMPPPPGPAGAYAPLAGWLVGISKKAKNPEAAWAFLAWATGKDTALEFYEKSGSINRDSIFTDPRATKGHEDFYRAFQQSLTQAANLGKKGLTWIPPVNMDVLQIAGDFGNRALLGHMTPAEACREAAKQIAASLKK